MRAIPITDHGAAFDRIVASLYEASLDDSRWRQTSLLIDQTCGINGTHLCIVGGNTPQDLKWLFDRAYRHGECREELARDYVENYFPRDERMPRLIALPDQRIVPVADLYTERELGFPRLTTNCCAAPGLRAA